jgi:predicted O-methyltransferase YrrM
LRSAVVQLLTVYQASRDRGFSDLDAVPSGISGFDDLAFLFSSNVLNYRIAGLRFDEAAHLYRLTSGLPSNATIAELGRFHGGSTFLFAAALDGGTVYSYDLESRYGLSGAQLDDALRQALAKATLASRVRLIVGDSRSADPPPGLCDAVFVDGDHTYAGVRADYERWRCMLKPGAHLLFHDAVAIDDFVPSVDAGVVAVVAEIESADGLYFERAAGAGTLAHFVRTEASAPWTP